jgi:hypothetical protein
MAASGQFPVAAVTTVARLASLNRIANPDKVPAGLRIRIA